MRWLGHELGLALGIVAVVATIYVLAVRSSGIPAASGWTGHLLGMAGFTLMLATETLYPLRKHWPRFTLGRMTLWLKSHIVMGLVGPFLILLHTGWRFEGLAGVTTLMLLIVVVSGFIGRYIYTAVPRTFEGMVVAAEELQTELDRIDARLAQRGLDRLTSQAERIAEELPQSGWWLVLLRPWWTLRLRWRLNALVARLPRAERALGQERTELLMQRFRLQLQLESLLAARQLLALWHLFHIPLGGALFTLAFIHVGAALYYASFLRW